MHRRVFQITAVMTAIFICAAMTYAGALGRGELTTRILPWGTDRFPPITFMGGESARVIVDGQSNTDLDLYIEDDRGNVVARDNDGTSYCIARWTPSRTGRYTIKVVNLGNAPNDYTLSID